MATWESYAPIVVSVLCPVFNHVAYIDEAISGFMMQVTSFPFEIIIRDDASTDGTSEKLEAYAALYPRIIRHERVSENRYAEGVRVLPPLIQAARGEYLALCDGDDYWSCADKLQSQLDLVRSTSGAIASCHRTSVVGATGKAARPERWWIDWRNKTLLTQSDLVSSSTPFHSSSFFVEANAVRDFTQDFVDQIVSEDIMLYMMASSRGHVARIDRVMSAYRRHGSGVTSSRDHRDRRSLLQSRIAMWSKIKEVAPDNSSLVADLVDDLQARLERLDASDALMRSARAAMKRPTAYPRILFEVSFWRVIGLEVKGLVRGVWQRLRDRTA